MVNWADGTVGGQNEPEYTGGYSNQQDGGDMLGSDYYAQQGVSYFEQTAQQEGYVYSEGDMGGQYNNGYDAQWYSQQTQGTENTAGYG